MEVSKWATNEAKQTAGKWNKQSRPRVKIETFSRNFSTREGIYKSLAGVTRNAFGSWSFFVCARSDARDASARYSWPLWEVKMDAQRAGKYSKTPANAKPVRLPLISWWIFKFQIVQQSETESTSLIQMFSSIVGKNGMKNCWKICYFADQRGDEGRGRGEETLTTERVGGALDEGNTSH